MVIDFIWEREKKNFLRLSSSSPLCRRGTAWIIVFLFGKENREQRIVLKIMIMRLFGQLKIEKSLRSLIKRGQDKITCKKIRNKKIT